MASNVASTGGPSFSDDGVPQGVDNFDAAASHSHSSSSSSILPGYAIALVVCGAVAVVLVGLILVIRSGTRTHTGSRGKSCVDKGSVDEMLFGVDYSNSSTFGFFYKSLLSSFFLSFC
jgi:hypothetical protein